MRYSPFLDDWEVLKRPAYEDKTLFLKAKPGEVVVVNNSEMRRLYVITEGMIFRTIPSHQGSRNL